MILLNMLIHYPNSRHLLVKRNISVVTKQLKLIKKLFCIGDRYWNVIHSKMRMNCSPLKEHLAHNLHVIENSTCDWPFGRKQFSFSFRMQTIYST